MPRITVGCDPEVFVHNGERFISAYNMIKGDKKHPTPVKDGAVQVDGFALEFNIDPVDNENDFVHNVNHVMSQLAGMIEHKIVIEAVAEFGKEYMDAQPAESLIMGCDPDYNAWDMCVNEKPSGKKTFRTAAGHIHVGYIIHDVQSTKAFFSAAKVARQLDFYLGLPSLFFDDSTKRRELYGKAGAFRVKPYGCEYRVLSNAWLKDDKLKAWVFRNTEKAMDALLSGIDLAMIEGSIEEVINKSDKEKALEIIKKYGIEMAE